MTLDEVLGSLFPSGHQIRTSPEGWVTGHATRKNGAPVSVIGVAHGWLWGPPECSHSRSRSWTSSTTGGAAPILVLVDAPGQLMARRDEMRGLDEYLGHLAKCLLLAGCVGHRTIGLEYGKAAAGSFLATALATDMLVALPGAEPAVMDMPSISRVTKLPESRLLELSKTTPVFARPGWTTWSSSEQSRPCGTVPSRWIDQLEQALGSASSTDTRDQLGAHRRGRLMAAEIAKRVIAEAAGQADLHAAA